MIPLSDKRWKDFEGGYRVRYDASVPLSKLESEARPRKAIWDELWENLHHQHDVGVATYASIPHIARIIRQRKILDYDPFALAVTIELARRNGKNPVLPKWLKETYHQALLDMAEYACESFKREWDSNLLKSVLSLLAIVKGNGALGELIIEVGDGEEKLLLEKYFESWEQA